MVTIKLMLFFNTPACMLAQFKKINVHYFLSICGDHAMHTPGCKSCLFSSSISLNHLLFMPPFCSLSWTLQPVTLQKETTASASKTQQQPTSSNETF